MSSADRLLVHLNVLLANTVDPHQTAPRDRSTVTDSHGGPEIIKLFFILSSIEHDINHTHKP